MVSFINDLFNGLKDFSDSYWFYVIIFAIAALDSVFPIVPSETLVIIGGVSAGTGDLSLALVMGSAFGGAFVGDHMSYFLGRRASHFITRRYERTERGKRRLATVIHQIHERDSFLVVAPSSPCHVELLNRNANGLLVGLLRPQQFGLLMHRFLVLLVEKPLRTITHSLFSLPLVSQLA
jgi:membrane protein YqaA with SNARE-associated domain